MSSTRSAATRRGSRSSIPTSARASRTREARPCRGSPPPTGSTSSRPRPRPSPSACARREIPQPARAAAYSALVGLLANDLLPRATFLTLVRVVGGGARRSRRLAGHRARRRGALPHRLRHRPGRLPLAPMTEPFPTDGVEVTLLLVVADVDRSRDWYRGRPRREPLSRVRRLIGGAAVPGNLAAARDRRRPDARQADRRLRARRRTPTASDHEITLRVPGLPTRPTRRCAIAAPSS